MLRINEYNHRILPFTTYDFDAPENHALRRQCPMEVTVVMKLSVRFMGQIIYANSFSLPIMASRRVFFFLFFYNAPSTNAGSARLSSAPISANARGACIRNSLHNWVGYDGHRQHHLIVWTCGKPGGRRCLLGWMRCDELLRTSQRGAAAGHLMATAAVLCQKLRVQKSGKEKTLSTRYLICICNKELFVAWRKAPHHRSKPHEPESSALWWWVPSPSSSSSVAYLLKSWGTQWVGWPWWRWWVHDFMSRKKSEHQGPSKSKFAGSLRITAERFLGPFFVSGRMFLWRDMIYLAKEVQHRGQGKR